MIWHTKRLTLRSLTLDDAEFILKLVNQPDFIRYIGINGVISRDGNENPEIGFGFLEQYYQQGFGYESSVAVLEHAKETLKLAKLSAICDQDNSPSQQLLTKLGLSFVSLLTLPNDSKGISLFEQVSLG